MKNHEAIIAVIVIDHNLCHALPVFGLDIARIQWLLKLQGIDLNMQLIHLWHMRCQVLEIERLVSSSLGIFDHTNSTSCVEDQYSWHMLVNRRH